MHAAFIGGTSLRLLHQLPRYSEDLDFIWLNNGTDINASDWTKALSKAVQKLGAFPEVVATQKSKENAKGQKRSLAIFVNATAPDFKSFAPLGIQISFDIDLDPPGHVDVEHRPMSFHGGEVTVQSLTLPSLMSGKLHILLTRQDREKGRDWFDYVWYRKNGIHPNLRMLQSAIEQTANGPKAKYWTSYIRARAKSIQWINVRADVSPFVENPESAKELNETKIDHITPYPNFSDILRELHADGHRHPILAKNSPLAYDMDQASLEGDIDAIYLKDAVIAAQTRTIEPRARDKDLKS